MKTILIFMLLVSSGLAAQVNEGKLIYSVERTIKGIQGGNIRVKDLGELLFTSKASVYQRIQEDTDDENVTGRVIHTQGSNLLYHDFTKKSRLNYREIFGKEFLISSGFKTFSWQFTGEEKVLAGHKVLKAVATKIDSSSQTIIEEGKVKEFRSLDTLKIEAWYAPGIPIAAGPEDFQGQLPGLIFELTVNKDEKVFRIKDLKGLDNPDRVKPPSKGKPVTQEQFKKESAAILEEQKKQHAFPSEIRRG